MSKQDGGPAFPWNFREIHHRSSGGMTLRDYFAGQALAGLCANMDLGIESAAWLAETAYRKADAMLAERDKP